VIFVAGATGYTGRFLVDALLRRGEALTCLVRDPAQATGLEARGAEVCVGDLARSETLREPVASAGAVVSVAHIRHAGTLAQVCRDVGTSRAVFLSSTWALSKVHTCDVAAVVCGEKALEASGLACTVLRPTMIYGPGDDRNVSRLRDLVRQRRVLPVVGSGERSVQPVYVGDVVEAILAVLWRSGTEGKTYEIAGPRALPYWEMVDAVCRGVGRTVLKVYVPYWAALASVKVYSLLTESPSVTVDQVRRMREDRAFDISAAAADFGFAPRPFEEGIRQVMRENGEDGA